MYIIYIYNVCLYMYIYRRQALKESLALIYAHMQAYNIYTGELQGCISPLLVLLY